MARKRGPKTPWSDEALMRLIRFVVRSSPFKTEGHRKVLARLRRLGVKTSKKRVFRLMGVLGLLKARPQKKRTRLSGWVTTKRHILTEAPNIIWGIDSSLLLLPDGTEITLFVVLEHWNSEVISWLVTPTAGTATEAEEVLRRALLYAFASAEEGVACGTSLRLDHWEVHLSVSFLERLARWGLEPFFIFPMQPQQNGVAERFFRTLKEELNSSTFSLSDLETALQAVGHWISSYNSLWLLARLGYRSPLEWRRLRLV